MSNKYTLTAVSRTDQGKGASRRLRNKGLVPAIIYGAGETPVSVSLKDNELRKALDDEAFYSSVINVSVDGSDTPVILRDLQRHPAREVAMHADFQRVTKGKIRMILPIHFLNAKTGPGVKVHGGHAYFSLLRVEVVCDSANIPNFLEVDMGNMERSDALHLSDIPLPEGTELPQLARGADYDLSVVTVH